MKIEYLENNQAKVTIPLDQGNTEPLKFSVNGETIMVPRGEEVVVDAKYAEVIKRYWAAGRYEKSTQEDQTGGSVNNRILLFEDKGINSGNKTIQFDNDIKAVLKSIGVETDKDLRQLPSNYRIILVICKTEDYFRYHMQNVIDYDYPSNEWDTSDIVSTVIDGGNMINYNPSYGGYFSIHKEITNEDYYTVTCYLEKK